MNSEFEHPIYYVEKKQKLDDNIIEDLELLELSKESDERVSLLETVIKPNSKIGVENLNKLCEYYTDDKSFIKDTQNIISKWENDTQLASKQKVYDEFYDMWKEIKNDENFIDRYYYVDVEFFKFLNNSSPFLQMLSLYNLFSPILTLIMPIILLIVPFFMLKYSGVDITLESYYEALKKIFSSHALGNITNIFSNVSIQQRVYALVSLGFYLFSIYQNSLVCYRFYKNFYTIHNNLFLLRDYLNISIENMEILEANCAKYKTYKPFLESIEPNKELCIRLRDKLNTISPFEFKNVYSKSNQIGFVMKYFYEFHTNPDVNSAIKFTLGMNSYSEYMNGLNSLYREKRINKCKFGKKMKFNDAYYPYLLNNEPVKNTIDMKKNIAITGPNASGKTTILKTTLLNIIFSQSFGFGFYSKGVLTPYNKIHCYLNIPDTSGRDSLFQAEARRCKEILESLEDNKKHFCIFDELFSGTNPNEACASSYGFIKYLIKKNNIDFILTTHLLDLCKKIDDIVDNCNMNVIPKDNFNFNYTYKINYGISEIKGGLKVLKDLEYPEFIMTESNNLLTKL